MTPPRARTWGRVGQTPIVRVRGRGSGRVSMAGMTCYKPGERTRLITLFHRVGIAPRPGWADLARRCFVTVCRLASRVHRNPRPLGTIRDAAYAWRQMVFHPSLCPPEEQRRVIAGLDEETARRPAHVVTRLAPALAGLALVSGGAAFGGDGTADGGRARRFLGWSTDGHWMR
ncbi:hypothetical protein ACFYNZ_19665 [Streptomyces kebangsaanensis]|uniref:Uncharacterized protein n=1 Tax=Streptomyces kebangsaanensis TaxID=864058 RepID=A0ABW6KUY2_9ACTN